MGKNAQAIMMSEKTVNRSLSRQPSERMDVLGSCVEDDTVKMNQRSISVESVWKKKKGTA